MGDKNQSKYQEQLTDYYNKQSGVYHTAYTGEGRYPTARHRMETCLNLIAQIEPRPEVILDAGCGDARILTELVKRGFNCTGFDVSDGLLDLGKARLQDAGFSPALIEKGDIYSIPAADNSCDLVLSLGVMENLDRHEEIFNEFRRVLKPGGRVLISLENHLFSLLTFNRQTVGFYKSLFTDSGIPAEIQDQVLGKISGWLDLPSIEQKARPIEDRQMDRAAVNLPVYHRLNIHEELEKFRFYPDKLRFCHVHPLPPRFETEYPKLFSDYAQTLETPEYKWQNTLLCNCMIVQAVVGK